jgi:predicted O-methyltransferase YrrM
MNYERAHTGPPLRKRTKTFSGQRGAQVETELTAFVLLLSERRACSYLEVGCKNGDTFHRVVCSLPPGALAVAVDLPASRSNERRLRRAVDDLVRRGYGAKLILGDSTSLNIVQQVVVHAPFDAVFIDGGHSYDVARLDWANYGVMSRVVGFHDVNGIEESCDRKGQPDMEVPRLWREIKAEHEVREFIDMEERVGIGVVLK